MTRIIDPQVFILSYTKVDKDEFDKALSAMGAGNWKTDANNDADLMAEFAGKLCYMSFDTALNENLTKTGSRNNKDYVQKAIIENKHGSVLEHCSVSMLFLNVSRVLTHELIRHRAGTAVTQLSGRYVLSKEFEYYVPECIKDHKIAFDKFIEAMDASQKFHRELVEIVGLKEMDNFTKKKEFTSALRRVLPNGQASAILFTANHRALRHIIQERTKGGAHAAEEEIRVVISELAGKLKERFPNIYDDMELAEDKVEWNFKTIKV